MSRYGFLPGVLAEIAEVAGLDAALRIAEKRGGASMSIPARMTDDHWLSMLIGIELATKLSKHYASGRTSQELAIPLGPTGTRRQLHTAIRRLLKDGVAGEEIARRLRIADRTVRRHKRGMHPTDRRQDRLL